MNTDTSTTDPIRIVLLCCSGEHQAYLANHLSRHFTLAGIVRCDPPDPRATLLGHISHLCGYLNVGKLVRHLDSKLNLPEFDRLSKKLLERDFPEFSTANTFPDDIPHIKVSNINVPQVSEFIESYKPDLVCVNGTNLLRQPILKLSEQIKHGFINLHTGLSPYSRGGNCNLHMLLEDKPQLVGATIHYIDQGIDSGDIIRTIRPEWASDDTYEHIESKAFIAGIDGMIDSIYRIMDGTAPRVKQWVHGKEFLRRTGYSYNPYLRLKANRKLKASLIYHYLANKAELDQEVKIIS